MVDTLNSNILLILSSVPCSPLGSPLLGETCHYTTKSVWAALSPTFKISYVFSLATPLLLGNCILANLPGDDNAWIEVGGIRID